MSAISIVKSFYDAVGKGDVAGMLGVLHPTLHWTEAEGFPYYSGTWHHPQEVVEKLLIPLARDWENFSATAEDFIASGERVVTLGVYSGIAKTTGKHMRAPFAHVWQVKDEKLARFDMYTDTLLIHRALHAA